MTKSSQIPSPRSITRTGYVFLALFSIQFAAGVVSARLSFISPAVLFGIQFGQVGLLAFLAAVTSGHFAVRLSVFAVALLSPIWLCNWGARQPIQPCFITVGVAGATAISGFVFWKRQARFEILGRSYGDQSPWINQYTLGQMLCLMLFLSVVFALWRVAMQQTDYPYYLLLIGFVLGIGCVNPFWMWSNPQGLPVRLPLAVFVQVACGCILGVIMQGRLGTEAVFWCGVTTTQAASIGLTLVAYRWSMRSSVFLR